MFYLPGDGKRKKAVVQQAITMPLSWTGGFEEIQGRRSFVPQRNDDHKLKITAALGGSRRETKTAST